MCEREEDMTDLETQQLECLAVERTTEVRKRTTPYHFHADRFCQVCGKRGVWIEMQSCANWDFVVCSGCGKQTDTHLKSEKDINAQVIGQLREKERQ